MSERGLARPLVGVLAVQGAFVEHEGALRRVGADTHQVRTPGDLENVDGLVIPGGESTTLGLLGSRTGLLTALRAALADGLPVFGTCAGMIMLADATTGGPQPLIGGLEMVVCRNAFGRQVASFEVDLSIPAVGERPFPGIFIRAPWAERVGAGLEVMAEHNGHVVAARTERALVTAFHPELTADLRLHDLFLGMVRGERTGVEDGAAPSRQRKGGERVRAQ